MKTILVPTDFSETANNALKVAAQLAKKFNSKLILLHMLEIPEHLLPDVPASNDVLLTRDSQSLPEAIFYMKLAHKRFEELTAQKFLEGVEYEEAVQNHLNFKGIIDSAHKYDADLIVMGSHGATGLKEVFVGSHTEKVVRTSDIPVLVIKAEIPDFHTNNIVFASDLSQDHPEVVQRAYNIATLLNATFHIVYINTMGRSFLTTKQIDEKYEQLLSQLMIDKGNISRHVYCDLNVEQGILNFGEKINADVLAVATHGRRGLSHFELHSIGESVANHSERPVMTFKLK